MISMDTLNAIAGVAVGALGIWYLIKQEREFAREEEDANDEESEEW